MKAKNWLYATVPLATLCVSLTACSSGSDDASSSSGTDIITSTDLDDWIYNTSESSEKIFESPTNSTGVLEDVQGTAEVTVDSVDYIYVEATGIPKYDVVITDDIYDGLSDRPKVSTDFNGGTVTTAVGDTVVFGENIGYNSNSTTDGNCTTTGGTGYWPPGPGCPIDVAKEQFLPADPEPNTGVCENGLGAAGIMVNGTSIFNWGDGQSEGTGIWYNLAPVAESYDVDICGGHAANGEYHHHFYTSCLADLVGDDGSEHSPIYGYVADGYPIYGPYESDGTLAVSGWLMRDYGATASEGGCGTAGQRTCTMIDEYDLSQGVDSTVDAGPDIGESVTSLSNNTFNADDGFYYEDYYYAQASATGVQLDQYNGHDNGDGRGYHYHLTLTDEAGTLTPSFPYTVGPRFYGELESNSMASCSSGAGGPPGPRRGA